ncbi:phosphotransferase [Arthrobacter sp. MYb224]|uniref:aminoglycoside phosphotransferase family protein n=1 Tax=unclassified Arthrobacter TaxID=235627 RepID=UPI000CFB0F96|nr:MULTISPECIES: aminoglycoside phosphotransferase family protein [unclassified Arthrobacter]PQZ98206.1 phosphotransferase [Arthrobacter sp. MYb224]PRA02388.1 phosphotransferase [Arthrobacter sp. MYb229]PRB50669.1 phosphotransferase [Arthrobacter sp. MYb216]
MTFQEMPVSAMPAAEVSIDRDLVRELILAQARQWAGKPLTYLATGWDNEVYRLGEDLLVRLPRRALAEKIGHKERQWLPRLSSDSGLDVGAAVFIGEPTANYPFTFSICRYVPGISAATLGRTQRDAYAPAFIDYLLALHGPAPEDAPRSEFRGCELQAVDRRTREQISQLPATYRRGAQGIWEQSLEAEAYGGPPRWLHGDPHPHNTIVTTVAGRAELSALVDFGDLCAGDPASDLGMLWMHFTEEPREQALQRYSVDRGMSMRLRARGWALRYAMLTAPLGAADPLGKIGRDTLKVLLKP